MWPGGLRWVLRRKGRPFCSSAGLRQQEKRPGKRANPATDKESSDRVRANLQAKIRLMGPLTVAQYMEDVLTGHASGYYRRKDVFGSSGDFTTSPEVSQMFGECVGVWAVHEWRRMGRPGPLQLVELGPGRGTLMADLLRTFTRLDPKGISTTSVHLVEVSEALRQLQEAQLCGSFHGKKEDGSSEGQGHIHEAVCKFGPPVRWYRRLEDVPKGFSFFIANEFFDALPIHQFVRAPEGGAGDKREWHEVLVDLDPKRPGELRMVKSRGRTPNAAVLAKNESRDVVEVSPKSGLVAQELARRVAEQGGAALVADYGHDGEDAGDTFRAFRDHRPHDPLADPGTADLTADVDFSFLRRHASADTLVYGPVEQMDFLRSLGIALRMEVLTRGCGDDASARAEIESAYSTLVDSDKMGRRFKFMSIFPATMQPIHDEAPPVGFQSHPKDMSK